MIEENCGNCRDFESDLRSVYGCFSVEPIRAQEDRPVRGVSGIADDRAEAGGRAHVASHGPFRAVDVTCSWVSCSRAAVLAAPWRDTVGIVVGLEGRLDIEHYGRRQCLGRSDILLLDTRENALFETWEGSHVAVLHMPRNGLISAARWGDIFGRVISGTEYTGRLLGALLLALTECEEQRDVRDSDVTTEVVVSLVSQAMAERGEETRRQFDVSTRLRAMSDWLMAHISEPDLSLDRLAAEFALSRRSLFRLFGRAGYTPQRWIRDQRLEYAHRRLTEADSREPAVISRICYESGFNDLSTFCHSFRRRFGVPPSAVCATQPKTGTR